MWRYSWTPWPGPMQECVGSGKWSKFDAHGWERASLWLPVMLAEPTVLGSRDPRIRASWVLPVTVQLYWARKMPHGDQDQGSVA